jgi:hypothetical protein
MCASERDGQRAPARAMLTFVFASTSVPFASSASTTAKWQFIEAVWSGVRPSCGAGEHRAQRLPSHQTHTLDLTHECMHSLMPTPRTHACTHTYTRTDMPTHEKKHTCTHMHTHALRYTLHTYTELCKSVSSQALTPLAPDSARARSRHDSLCLPAHMKCCRLRACPNIMARHSPAYSLALTT